MSHVLCVYDIPERLKLRNPSATFRRYGVRLNLSAWAFPTHLTPTDEIDRLREGGAEVHLIRFAPEDQDKIVALAVAELRRHAGNINDLVLARSAAARNILEASYGLDTPPETAYRQWRSTLAKGRRELLAAEQCALGGLKNLLGAELTLALAWKDRLAQASAPGANAADCRTYPLVAVPEGSAS